MSTYFSAPLSLPTASVPAFIALAGPADSAREDLSGEAQMGLNKILEADGALGGDAPEFAGSVPSSLRDNRPFSVV